MVWIKFGDSDAEHVCRPPTRRPYKDERLYPGDTWMCDGRLRLGTQSCGRIWVVDVRGDWRAAAMDEVMAVHQMKDPRT
jgi:hypothetical protein